jgi:hypothetical protein
MQIEQKRKEESHREAADEASEREEAHAEERCADKAAYLREKLDERARAEDETD